LCQNSDLIFKVGKRLRLATQDRRFSVGDASNGALAFGAAGNRLSLAMSEAAPTQANVNLLGFTAPCVRYKEFGS
jgi:hypothetical protein